MSIDPDYKRWLEDYLGRVDTDIGKLLAETGEGAKALASVTQALAVIDSRLKALEESDKYWKRAVIAIVAASAAGVVWWGSGIDRDVKRTAEDRAALSKLADEFHEHERRSSTPKPEGK